MNFEEKVKKDLTDQGVDVTPTTVMHDLFLRKFLELHTPFVEEREEYLRRFNFTEFGHLTEEDLVKFGGNFFVTPRGGERASGRVRLYYPYPVDVSVPEGTVFSTEPGLRFLAGPGAQNILADQMVANLDGIYYFFDVNVIAEEVGEEYNVGPGEITQCDNMVISSNTTKIQNTLAFDTGTGPEKPEPLFNRTRESITVLNLANNKSIKKVIRDNFPDTTKMYVVRAKHDEMYRDRLIVDIDGIPTEVRVGNMVDVYIDSLRTQTFKTVVYNNGEDEIPFGYGAPDFQEAPIPNVVFKVVAVRISDVNGELIGDEVASGGWQYAQDKDHENSTKQNGTLTITDPDYVGTSQYYEVEYYGSAYIPQIQALIESNEERMPVGDYLVKGFFLSFLSGAIQYVGPTPAEDMQTAVDNYLRGYMEAELEISDIVDVMYRAGATKVVLPIELSMEEQDGTTTLFEDSYQLASKETFISRSVVVVKVG